MFDPDDSEDTAMALRYEHELIRDARENPRICEGMLVRVYGAEEWRPFIGVGIVVRGSMIWNDFYCQYIVDVEMADGVYPKILAGFLEREVRLPSALRRDNVCSGR